MRPESVPLVEARFEWFRPHPDYLAPVNEDRVATESLKDEHVIFYSPPKGLYKEFANLFFEENFPAAVHRFVAKWGFLGIGAPDTEPPSDGSYEEELDAWCYFSINMFSFVVVLPFAKSPPKGPPLRHVEGNLYQIPQPWSETMGRRAKELQKGRVPNRGVMRRALKFAEKWKSFVARRNPPITWSPPARVEVNIETAGGAAIFWSACSQLLMNLEPNVGVYLNPLVKAPYLTVYPKNLLGFMYLQLLESLVADYFPRGRLCPECEKVMPNPRPNQIYCSARCRKRAFRARKNAS